MNTQHHFPLQLLLIVGIAAAPVQVSAQLTPMPLDLSGLGVLAWCITAPTQQAVYVALDNGNNSIPTTLYARSLDGGLDWTLRSIPAAQGRSIMSLFALDDLTVWASLSNSSSGAIMRTMNGGDTWEQVTTTQFNPGFLNFTYFTTLDSGVACGDVQGGYFEIHTTTNGGASWVRTPQANIPPPLPGEHGWANSYHAIGRTVWMNTNGRVFRTDDLGASWSIVPLPPGPPSDPDIQFNDMLHGASHHTTSTYPVQVTDDGGATWSPRAFDPPLNIVRIVAVPDVPGAYFFTTVSPILLNVTVDNFQSYQVIDDQLQCSPYSFVMVNDDLGWIAPFAFGSATGIYRIGTEPTSINERAAEGQVLNVFPNPIVTEHALVTMNVGAHPRNELMLFDPAGRVIRSWSFQTDGRTARVLDVTGLPAGHYQLVLRHGDRRYSHSVVVAR
jgi:hypothetical protein